MGRRVLLAVVVASAVAAAPAGAQPLRAEDALHTAIQLKRGVGVTTGHELTPALQEIYLKLPRLHGAQRRRAERLLARPTQGQGNPGEDTYAVPEATPVCGTHFCVHYVAVTDDAPSLLDTNLDGAPDYVETMLAEFEHVYDVENVQLGWRAPKPDGGLGGDDRTDVYIKNIGAGGIFGYSAPDPGQRGHQVAAFLVMDNDYSQAEYRRYSEFLSPLRVTAAHEYNHVLQFNYDVQQDTWMFEASAVWMEDKVYDDVNDYLSYLTEWSKRSTQPLTEFVANGDNIKIYGDAVFNRWIDEHVGPDAIRRAWEVSVETRSFAPGAYDRALRERGQSFYGVFTRFAADTAEWRAANTAFEEGGTFPDMARALENESISPQNVTGDRNDFVEGGLDHTGYALVDIADRGQARLTLGATFRRGVPGAIALVGRTGPDAGGSAVVELKRLPHGGPGKVTLSGASGFSRVTAVIVNADVAYAGYSAYLGDWVWLGDAEPVTLAVNDFTKPKLKRVAAGRAFALTFSESVAGVTQSSVRLLRGGRKVRVRLSQSADGKRVMLRPTRRLRAGARYTVTLSSGVTDPAGNAVTSSSRTKRVTARRAPRAAA
jgi:hypothetical protein